MMTYIFFSSLSLIHTEESHPSKPDGKKGLSACSSFQMHGCDSISGTLGFSLASFRPPRLPIEHTLIENGTRNNKEQESLSTVHVCFIICFQEIFFLFYFHFMYQYINWLLLLCCCCCLSSSVSQLLSGSARRINSNYRSRSKNKGENPCRDYLLLLFCFSRGAHVLLFLTARIKDNVILICGEKLRIPKL